MAFKSRARVRDPPRLDDGFIHGEGTSSEGGLACLPVTMYERILTMRKMRLMRRAAPAAAQMETPDGIAAARTRTTSNATSAASIPRRESLIELAPLVPPPVMLPVMRSMRVFYSLCLKKSRDLVLSSGVAGLVGLPLYNL